MHACCSPMCCICMPCAALLLLLPVVRGGCCRCHGGDFGGTSLGAYFKDCLQLPRWGIPAWLYWYTREGVCGRVQDSSSCMLLCTALSVCSSQKRQRWGVPTYCN